MAAACLGAMRLVFLATLAVVALAAPEVMPLWEQQQADFNGMLPEEMELEVVEEDASQGGSGVPNAFNKPFPFDPVADKFAGKAAGLPGDDPMANPVATLPFPKTVIPPSPCFQHVNHQFEWSTTRLGQAVSGVGNWTANGTIGSGMRTKASLKTHDGAFYADYVIDIMKAPGDACFAVVKPTKWNNEATGANPTKSCVTFYPDVRTHISTGCGSTGEKCLDSCEGATGATGGGMTVWHNIDHA